jgi:hypothetical protein
MTYVIALPCVDVLRVGVDTSLVAALPTQGS